MDTTEFVNHLSPPEDDRYIDRKEAIASIIFDYEGWTEEEERPHEETCHTLAEQILEHLDPLIHKFDVELGPDYIRVVDRHERELYYWTEEEWIEDPQVLISIVNCVIKAKEGTLGEYVETTKERNEEIEASTPEEEEEIQNDPDFT